MFQECIFPSSLRGMIDMDYDYDQLVEAFEYLDDLRASGATNMFGAGPYVQRDLGHDRRTSMKLVQYWMETFSEESASDRAKSLEGTF